MWTRPGSRALLAVAALAVSAVAAPAHARGDEDVEFYDTLNANEVQLGDTVTLTVQLSGGEGAMNADLELPPMPQFEILSRHNSTSMRMSLSGGQAQVVRSRVLTVVLQPKQTGNLRIAPVLAHVGGRTFKTGELSLRVVAADPNARRQPPRAQPQQQPDPFAQFFGGQNPFAGMPGSDGSDDDGDPFEQFFGQGQGPPKDSDLFLRTTVDKKQAYLGEQVTFSIYLFARVDVSRVDNPKMPKLDAFWAEDIDSPTNISGDVKTVNGIPYRVYMLKRRALFPLKAGKQTIDPVEVDVVSGLSLFGNGHTSHRTSQGLEVQVLPLPAGAPAGFATTNVGQWRVQLATNPPVAGPVSGTVGQPVTVDVTVEGFGNLRNLTLPKLAAPRGLRVYDPTTTDKVQIVKNRFGGKRVLEYIVMPEQTGSFEIPPVELPYFNPQSQKYEVARSEPIKLQIGTAAGGAVAQGPNGAVVNPSAGQNVLGGNLARPIHTRGALSEGARPLWNAPWFVPVLLLPFAVLFGGAAFTGIKSRATREDPTRKVRTAHSRARKRFKGAEALLEAGDANAYYGAVAKGLNDYLSDKLGFAAAGLTRDELGRRLLLAGASAQNVGEVNAVFEACDVGRFAPGSTQGRRDVLEQAASAVEALEDAKLRHVAPPEARA